jgi:SAM-dependent methyltransferase
MMTNDKWEHQKPVDTREWYDFVALITDVAPGLHPGGREATRTLLQTLQLEASDHVLDVGCGPGATAILIAREIGARVTGIDISEAMIAKARGRAQQEGLAEKVRFQVGNVLDLEFSDGTFDAVVLESLLTVIPGDPADALAEITRVLCPGGHVGGNEAILESPVSPEFESLLAEHPATQRTFTPETLRKQFEETGLLEIEVEVVPASEAPSLDISSAFGELGLGGLLSFFLRSYPRLLRKLLSDRRFRKAQQIDEQVTKLGEEYMGYALIVGRKPG